MTSLIASREYDYKRDCRINFGRGVFGILCIVTGQFAYRKPTEQGQQSEQSKWYASSCCIRIFFLVQYFWLIVFVIINLSSFVGGPVVIALCSFKHCGYIYKDVNQTILKEELPTEESPTRTDLDEIKYYDWQKVVITTSSVAASLSYFLIVFALYSQYECVRYLMDWFKCLCKCIWNADSGPEHHHSQKNDEDDKQTVTLDPFDDSEIKVEMFSCSTSTLLTSKQTLYFLFFLLINILTYLAEISLFISILTEKLTGHKRVIKFLDISLFIVQFGSQFCAIVSCFIFSKVVYGVSNRFLDAAKCIIPKVNTADPKTLLPDDLNIQRSNNPHLTLLKRIDQHYVQLMDATLRPYTTWFSIHWVLYTITAFMGVAIVGDAISMELYGASSTYMFRHCHGERHYDCRMSLAYQIFFALQHQLLFLYPCFRAASVNSAREKMIVSVSKADWEHVPLAEKESFIQYMKDQNCSFKISICCINVSFGFNTAFISIFIGMVSVLLALHS